jgi:hypothetical protein
MLMKTKEGEIKVLGSRAQGEGNLQWRSPEAPTKGIQTPSFLTPDS